MGKKLSDLKYKAKLFLGARLHKARVNNVFSYEPLLDREKFQIYKRPVGGKKIECAADTVAVLSHKNKLIIYPDYRYPSIKYTVTFDEKNLPGLIPGSKYMYSRVIPYYRWISKTQSVKAWRLMVVTDKGQIYHNYPARREDCEGRSEALDVIRFEESVVWDLPERKYPTEKRECAEYERYFLGLPKTAYEYHPAISKRGRYGGAGFGATCKTEIGELPRFYISRREAQGNPFYYMSGFSADRKMAVLATYRGNLTVGVRTCVFMSDDGGRQWFCKYEFGDMGEYKFKQGKSEWGRNFGNPITAPQGGNGTLSLRKRTCIVPTNADKDPEKKFNWDEPKSFSVSCENGRLTLTSDSQCGYETGNIVSVASAESPLEWMINSDVNETSAGNGLLFKVEVVAENKIYLHEFVASPYNPISCRHIHHINRVRDGWIVGTGEIYPNSWILYIQMKEADTFAERYARDKFDIFRLNSSETSVQRTLGVLWTDDECNTLMYASDHDVLEDKTVFAPVEGRDVKLSRNATGVYLGKLSDIDDYNKFKPILEATEPAYLLQNIESATVFSGQGGELAVSFDGGLSWDCSRIDGALNHPKGATYQYHIFDDYLLKIK